MATAIKSIAEAELALKPHQRRQLESLRALQRATIDAMNGVLARGRINDVQMGYLARAGAAVFDLEQIEHAYDEQVAASLALDEDEAAMERRDRDRLASDYRWGCRA